MGKSVYGECRLCRQQRKLCQSHIIPEWAYRPIYDEDSRAIAISSEDGRRSKVQSGLWEHLFCEDCETLFNRRFDQPFHRFWSSPRRFPLNLSNTLAIKISGIDHETTRRFLLSVLWRAHVSTKPILSAVKLGPHADRIRHLLVADPGAALDDGYPIYCGALRDPDTGGLARELVFTPARTRTNGQWNYDMAFLGCCWKIFVSRSAPALPRSCMLKNDGTILMPVMNYREVFAIGRLLGKA